MVQTENQLAAHRAIDAIWRIESAKIIASIARIVRDIGVAEELAQDALVAALHEWPESGVPRNPAAWLTAAAKNRAIDHLRRWRYGSKRAWVRLRRVLTMRSATIFCG